MENSPLVALETLASVSFDARDTLPPVSGVYLALSAANEVLYVGATTNLRQRWKQHHRVARLQSLACVRIAWYPCEGLIIASMECALIQHFQPPLNTPWHPVPPRPPKRDISATSFFLSHETKRLWRSLAEKLGISQSATLEIVIREFADREQVL